MPKEPVKLADKEIQAHLKNLPHWEIDSGMLQRRFTLPSFPCTGYLAHPFGKSRCKKERMCLHWLQMDVHRGYNLRM